MTLASRCRSSMLFPWRYWAKRFLGVMPNAERMPVFIVGLCERSTDVDVRLLPVCRKIFMLTMMLWYKHAAKLSISVDISKWDERFFAWRKRKAPFKLPWIEVKEFYVGCIVSEGLICLPCDVQFRVVLKPPCGYTASMGHPILKSRRRHADLMRVSVKGRSKKSGLVCRYCKMWLLKPAL